VIDTSALVALLHDELDAGALWAALRRFERHVIPASAYLEFVMATSERAGSRGWIDTFVAVFQTEIYPIDSWVAGEAADAFERFGRGSGHRARLNFGDCMSYGLPQNSGFHSFSRAMISRIRTSSGRSDPLDVSRNTHDAPPCRLLRPHR
jgi:ribonuclease VapC